VRWLKKLNDYKATVERGYYKHNVINTQLCLITESSFLVEKYEWRTTWTEHLILNIVKFQKISST